MKGLTRQQHKALAFIRAFKLRKGFPPTIREITDGLGLHSTGGAWRLIHGLADRGAITLAPGQSRSIAIVDGDAISVSLPRDLAVTVAELAASAGVTPEAIIIEAVRDRLSALRSQNVTRETRPHLITNIGAA